MTIPTQNVDTVRFIKGPTILLSTGAYFDYGDPENSAFTIEDIANGLAMTCRFGGQCRRHYSVAQHSWHMSYVVPPQDALAALMHDAAEAFVGDLPKPLKVLLPEYKSIEIRIENAIFDRFRIARPLPASIKEADVRMLVTEQREVMHNRDDWDYTRGREPYQFALPIWAPHEARAQFLGRFRDLTLRSGA